MALSVTSTEGQKTGTRDASNPSRRLLVQATHRPCRAAPRGRPDRLERVPLPALASVRLLAVVRQLPPHENESLIAFFG
jgi:hypothetical protein